MLIQIYYKYYGNLGFDIQHSISGYSGFQQ